MTTPKVRNGWATRIALGLSALVLLIGLVAPAAVANWRVGDNATDLADHENRIRTMEKTQMQVAADVRIIRMLMEQEAKRKEQP